VAMFNKSLKYLRTDFASMSGNPGIYRRVGRKFER